MSSKKNSWSIDQQIIDNSQKGADASPTNTVVWDFISGVVVIILIIVALIQLFKIIRLPESVQGAQIDGRQTQNIKPAASIQPSPVSSLPAQVGGC